MSYTFHGKAHRWKTLKMDISIHKRRDGIPTLMSGYEILGLGLMAPEDVRKEMTICVECQTRILNIDGKLTVCQNERKMTSLIASTFRSGWCSARSFFSWM